MNSPFPSQIPQFLLAAPSSGAGKTTVSRGLMALLTSKGMRVQPFKCGPDYIDTKYHAAVCGRPSINLDSFLAEPEHIRSLYASRAADADVCIVEGMMGMYDGYDHDCGSSGEIACLLRVPVILVVDARSAAYSLAPLLSGFIHFRPDVEVVGVIFNRVGSPRHFEMLRQVCEDVNVDCLGYLPRRKELEQESRYLGLDFSRSSVNEAVGPLVSLMEQTVDWQLLLGKTLRPRPAVPAVATDTSAPISGSAPHIVVARNEESFSFIYEEHLDILRRLGRLTFINPEEDFPIPDDTALLYLPGGYPERHAEALSRATRCIDSIRRYAHNGGRVLAECGGMIYLSAGLRSNGSFTPLCGVLPFHISDEPEHRRLSLGYRLFEWNEHILFGHEFHYTQLVWPEGVQPIPSAASLFDAMDRRVSTPVFHCGNVIASYTHIYWGGLNPFRLFDECSEGK